MKRASWHERRFGFAPSDVTVVRRGTRAMVEMSVSASHCSAWEGRASQEGGVLDLSFHARRPCVKEYCVLRTTWDIAVPQGVAQIRFRGVDLQEQPQLPVPQWQQVALPDAAWARAERWTLSLPTSDIRVIPTRGPTLRLLASREDSSDGAELHSVSPGGRIRWSHRFSDACRATDVQTIPDGAGGIWALCGHRADQLIRLDGSGVLTESYTFSSAGLGSSTRSALTRDGNGVLVYREQSRRSCGEARGCSEVLSVTEGQAPFRVRQSDVPQASDGTLLYRREYVDDVLSAVDGAGEERWRTRLAMEAVSLHGRPEGGVVVSGISETSSIVSALLLAQYEADGSQAWSSEVGGLLRPSVASVWPLEDGVVVELTALDPDRPGRKSAWLRFDPDGRLRWGSDAKILAASGPWVLALREGTLTAFELATLDAAAAIP